LALSYSVLDDARHPSHEGGSGVFRQAEFREPVRNLLHAALAPIIGASPGHPTGTIESSSDKLLPSYDGGHHRPRQTALGSRQSAVTPNGYCDLCIAVMIPLSVMRF